MALQAEGRFIEAEARLRRATELEPDRASFHNNHGSLLGQMGRYAEAEKAFRRALELDARYVKAQANLAVALVKLERFAEAEIEARAAITIQPDLPEAHAALGSALDGLGRPVAAIQALHVALELRPTSNDLAIHLSKLLGDMGRQDAATALLRALAAQSPEDPARRGNLLYGLHHAHGDDGLLMLREHADWSARHAEPLRSQIQPHLNDRSPDRRLRVAYVSADFREHPASRFLLPLIEAHDPSQVEVFCYNDATQLNSLTDRFRAAAHVWRETGAMSDKTLADQVRQDAIDVFVDPTGFMASNRILTFARKPAPVQVSYFGYPGTVALSAIEWRLTDSLLDPPGMTESHYTEKLIRIGPSAMVYAPLSETDDVQPTPALKEGFITFGALNRLSKVTPAVIALWGRILSAVPRSRLLLLSPTMHEQEANDEIRRLFARHGVPPDRLELAPRSPRSSYLKLFHLIDIHLDPFPYNGCTTTCDGMWMGVPTVTLAGRAYASRMGVSLLTQVGLQELVATTPEHYVQVATRLAGDVLRLNQLRCSMRDRMVRSPLMDYKGLARNIEAAFRQMWKAWCESER
jgi:predicted O-linked N-acetylglucosamine transferase (SPINDLY family)